MGKRFRKFLNGWGDGGSGGSSDDQNSKLLPTSQVNNFTLLANSPKRGGRGLRVEKPARLRSEFVQVNQNKYKH